MLLNEFKLHGDQMWKYAKQTQLASVFKTWHWEEPSTCKYCQHGWSPVPKNSRVRQLKDISVTGLMGVQTAANKVWIDQATSCVHRSVCVCLCVHVWVCVWVKNNFLGKQNMSCPSCFLNFPSFLVPIHVLFCSYTNSWCLQKRQAHRRRRPQRQTTEWYFFSAMETSLVRLS